jgi:HB1, ASXL, restriction endonuclease HTH domain
MAAKKSTKASKQNPAAKPRAASKTKATKGRRAHRAHAAEQHQKLSALAAAARVLEENGQPMSCPEMIQAMAAKGYWKTPAGKTPQATLASAIQREIKTKGDEARFHKTAPGKFTRA